MYTQESGSDEYHLALSHLITDINTYMLVRPQIELLLRDVLILMVKGNMYHPA